MAIQGWKKVPVCFLSTCRCGRELRHDTLVVNEDPKDGHVWMTPNELAQQIGLHRVVWEVKGKEFDLENVRLNNFSPVCDNASASKGALAYANQSASNVAIMFFALYTSIYPNEGHYLFTFLDLVERVTAPPVLSVDSTVPLAIYEATCICVWLYGRQPFGGYCIQTFTKADEDPDIVTPYPTMGVKPWRFAGGWKYTDVAWSRQGRSSIGAQHLRSMAALRF